MRKKFIGPPNPGPGGVEQGHDLSVAGQQYHVKPGEVIDFPDELVKATDDWPGVAFPESLWEDAPAEKSRAKKSNDAGDGED